MSQFVTDTTRPLHRFDTSRNRLIMLAIIVLGLVFGVANQTVLASSHNDPVNGCYDANSGVLRHIGSGTCRNNEVAISWPSMSDFATLEAALLAEQQARESANTALEAALAEETQARETLERALATEVAAREALAATVSSQASEIAQLRTDLDAEIAARQAGDIKAVTDANTHTDKEVAEEKTTRSALIENLRSVATGIFNIIKAWATGDFDGAWTALLDTARMILPDHVVDAMEKAGNFLGDLLAWLADIFGAGGTVEEKQAQ